MIDGRASLLEECQTCAPELRRYLGERFQTLLAMRPFVDALSGHLPGDAASQQRLPDLIEKLGRIARLHLP